MDELYSIETPIYMYKRIEQKGNKIKCKRKKDNIHKRYEINQIISREYLMILNNAEQNGVVNP